MKHLKKYFGFTLLVLSMLTVPAGSILFVPHGQFVTVAEAKTLTKKQAKKKLVTYLKKKKLYKKSYKLDYEGVEGKKYVFHYYQDMGTHTATVNWYYVNKKTGKISAMF